jgi:hypothetical protein
MESRITLLESDEIEDDVRGAVAEGLQKRIGGISSSLKGGIT